MAEYIEREAAIEALRSGFSYHSYAGESAAKIINAIPAADVRPVVRARWTDHRTIEHDGEWYCSNCGNEVTICMCGKDETRYYPFCPNCGATMETRARWIPNAPPRDLRPRCSACGVLNPTKENFCPNCGAEMEEES